MNLRFARLLAAALAVSWGSTQGAVEVLYLTRHGESGTNQKEILIAQQLHPEAVLSDKGKEHAASLSALLAGQMIDRIYVSRLVRSRETVDPIADRLGIDPVVRSELDEMNFGSLEGKSMKDPEVKEMLNRIGSDCTYRAGGGETKEEVQARVGQLLEEVSREDAPRRILMVGHYGSVQALLGKLLKLSCEVMGKIVPKNDDVFRLEIKKGKVVSLQRSQKREPFKEVTVEEIAEGRAK